MTRIFSLLFILISISILAADNTTACTVFNYNQGNIVLVGNNEDGGYSTDVEIWFAPPSGKKYGRVCFGWKQLFFFKQAQGGMNDQGLFFDWALCPKSDPPKFSIHKKTASFSMPENLLAECATVEEAIEWLKHYNILFIRSHIMLADRTGNSAVVEWVDGKMNVIKKSGTYQIITNFWLSHPELGNYPCPRYNTVTKMLKARSGVSVEYFTSILKLTAQHEQSDKGKESGTIYSNIYDLAKGSVYIYYKRDFKHPYKFNLNEELKKGNHSYKLEALFE
jgi:choloylglycine hydrolase